MAKGDDAFPLPPLLKQKRKEMRRISIFIQQKRKKKLKYLPKQANSNLHSTTAGTSTFKFKSTTAGTSTFTFNIQLTTSTFTFTFN